MANPVSFTAPLRNEGMPGSTYPIATSLRSTATPLSPQEQARRLRSILDEAISILDDMEDEDLF